MEGLLAKIILILGLFGIIKAVFFLKAQAADRVIEWYLEQPIKIFRNWFAGCVKEFEVCTALSYDSTN